MTRYYVDVSDDLLKGDYAIAWPEGFRLVERFGPKDLFFQRWLVEDDHAPPEFEGHLVVLSISWDRDERKAEITHREKLSLRY